MMLLDSLKYLYIRCYLGYGIWGLQIYTFDTSQYGKDQGDEVLCLLFLSRVLLIP